MDQIITFQISVSQLIGAMLLMGVVLGVSCVALIAKTPKPFLSKCTTNSKGKTMKQFKAPPKETP